MKKIVVASDSFKGSLSSKDIVNIFNESVSKLSLNTTVVGACVGDGGEGTVESISKILDGRMVSVNSVNPLAKPHKGKYFISNNNEAFIEIASSDGLTLVKTKNPSTLTSYGVGLEILDAYNKKVNKIYLCLGGSATNDGGTGLLSALGVKFLNKENESFIPLGKNLNQITKIDTSNLKIDIPIVLLSDVTNPLLGENGATMVYSKQKGADKKMMDMLEENMKYYNEVVKQTTNKDYSNIPGSGAAGGIGFGCLAFLKAEIKSGIDTILDLINFDQLIKDADYIFTGEGKLDSQSVQGKVISGVLKRAKKANIPTIAIVGGVTADGEDNIYKDMGLTAIFTTNRVPLESSKAKLCAKDFYKHTIENILKLINEIEK